MRFARADARACRGADAGAAGIYDVLDSPLMTERVHALSAISCAEQPHARSRVLPSLARDLTAKPLARFRR